MAEGTVAKRRTGLLLAGAGLAAMVVAAILPAVGAGTDAPARARTVSEIKILASSALPERSIGRIEAPVTVVEYASATCGHCARFSVEEMP